MRANVSSNTTPILDVQNLDSHSSYTLILYAANAKGRSEEVTLYTVGIRSPDKYTGNILLINIHKIRYFVGNTKIAELVTLNEIV